MKRKTSIILSTLFLITLFSLKIFAGTFIIEPGIYYQTSRIQSGTYLETTQYGEDKGNYLSIFKDLTNKTTFEWYDTSYSGYAFRVMSGTITQNADGSYTVVNDINDPNNDIVESCIESITPISDSEILVYNWGEGDGRWDNYITMKRLNTSESQGNTSNYNVSTTSTSVAGKYVLSDSPSNYILISPLQNNTSINCEWWYTDNGNNFKKISAITLYYKEPNLWETTDGKEYIEYDGLGTITHGEFYGVHPFYATYYKVK